MTSMAALLGLRTPLHDYTRSVLLADGYLLLGLVIYLAFRGII